MRIGFVLLAVSAASCTRTDNVGFQLGGLGEHARDDGTCDPGFVNCASYCYTACDGGSQNPDGSTAPDTGADGGMSCLPEGSECTDFSRCCPGTLCDGQNGGPGHCRSGDMPDSGSHCDLQASPARVDIGSLSVGSTTVRSFSLVNAGLGACRVLSFSLAQGSSSELGVAGPATPFDLPAGTSQQISVMFDPVQPGMVSGAVDVIWEGILGTPLSVPITADGTGMAIDAGPAPDVGPHCVAVGDSCDNLGALCCQGATCADVGGGRHVCVTSALDAGTMCLPNASTCTSNDQCCSRNCILRVSPGFCCEPGGCP